MNYLHSLNRIREYWSKQCRVCGSPARVVLVDLLHNHDEYLFRSLLIGRYVAINLGARLVGLAGHSGVMAAVPYDRQHVLALAEAFRLDDVLETPQPAITSRSSAEDVIGCGTPLCSETLFELNEVRDEVGIPIGRYYHDTHLRRLRIPTVYSTSLWDETKKEVKGFSRWSSEVVRRYPQAIFVTGHLDYSPWGVLGEHVLRGGGKIVYFRCDGFVPLLVLDRECSGETLNGALHLAQASCYENIVERMGGIEATIENLSPYVEAMAQGRQFPGWRTPTVAQNLPRRTDIVNRKVCQDEWVLYCHTFSDQPVADQQLFPNHYEWLRETLEERAGRDYGAPLTVKPHPLNELFDQYGIMGRLREKYSNGATIKFADGDKSTLAARAVGGLTVRGSVSYELPMIGYPVLATGRSGWSEFGVLPRVETREDYWSLLRAGQCRAVDWEQVLRARLFGILDRVVAPPSSPLLQAFRGMELRSIWNDLADQLPWHVIERDDLFQSIARHEDRSGIIVSTFASRLDR